MAHTYSPALRYYRTGFCHSITPLADTRIWVVPRSDEHHDSLVIPSLHPMLPLLLV